MAGLGVGTVWAEQRSSESLRVAAQASPSASTEPSSAPLAPPAVGNQDAGRARALPSVIRLQDRVWLAGVPPALAPQSAAPISASPAAPPTMSEAAQRASPQTPTRSAPHEEYRVGIDDILNIDILQPEKLSTTVTVGPDGLISFPFIGGVSVKGLTISQIQEEVQQRLADGYMKYPVVSVSLQESRSRKFFVYGEVTKPGPYILDEHTTVMRAIAVAGGFTKYGSSSRVKVLRPRLEETGYETMKINIKAVMDGDSGQDLVLQPGDTVVVSEGVF